MKNVLNQCSFEGSLLNDTRSKVLVSRCVSDTGTVDVSIMSKKVVYQVFQGLEEHKLILG